MKYAVEVTGTGKRRVYVVKAVSEGGTVPAIAKRFRSESAARAAAADAGMEIIAVGDFYQILHAFRRAEPT